MAALLALYASSIAAPTQPVLTTTVSTPVVLAAQQTELMEFDAWANMFERAYSEEERATRAAVFADTVALISKHNAEADAGMHNFRLGVNQFSDMTSAEWSAYALSPTEYPVKPDSERNIVELAAPAVGAAVDWRTKGAVTPVKNQGGCGSCWAFSTTGSTEGAYFLATGELRSLSEQQLVDCSHKQGNNGCKGGIMESGFKYILANGGIDSEKDYNYTAKDGECWAAAEKRVVATINNFTDVKQKDEAQLQAAVMINPVSIAIEADHPYFQHYKSGTLDNSTACGFKLDHGVLVVGMTDDAYIVKNSWGPTWGVGGYVMLKKNVANPKDAGAGMCGMATQPTYPDVKKGTAPPIPPPTPGAPPQPKPPTYKHPFGDPYTGPCEAGEQNVQITGLKGAMCCPACSPTIACPTAGLPAGTTAKPTCALGAPGAAPTLCALVCAGNNIFTGQTELNDLVCPAKASCKPISTTAICTYDQGPAPAPGPPGPPPAPGSGHYGDPSAGPCKADEKKVQITGLKGDFCSPTCSTATPCPADVPAGTTAKGECMLETPGSPGPSQCALLCKGTNVFTQQTELVDAKCPAKASCKPISTTAICTYDSR